MLAGQQEALVVEDDDAIREVLRDLLEDAGYVVQDVADGEDALAILRAHTHGLLVLLDNQLPSLDGAAVLAALDDDAAGALDDAAQGEPIPHAIMRHAYILLTASPQKITPELAARLARLDGQIVAKPFDLTTFTAAVNQAAHHLSLAP